VQTEKGKAERNRKLNILNVSLEPCNLRWVYFYCRDLIGYRTNDEIYKILTWHVSLDFLTSGKEFGASEVNYVALLLDVIARIKLTDTSYASYSKILHALNLLGYSSNSYYYEKMRIFIEWKCVAFQSLSDILNNICDLKENSSHLIHSEGFHLDQMLAIFLYENGFLNESTDIFKSLNDNDFKNSLIDVFLAKLN
jgi:hypothetical protein